MNNIPRVNVLILNWNGSKVLLDCVNSVMQSNYSNFKITVIDNGSTDDSIEVLLREIDNIEVINILKNSGFSRGYNFAFNKIINQGDDLYLILNNDTIVEQNSLSSLVNAMNYYGDDNIYGPRIINFNNQKNWYCGGKINCITGNVSHLGINHSSSLIEYKTSETDYVSGCCMLLSKKMINDLNGFNEIYRMYYEDVDLCVRIKQKNKKCYFISESIIYHKVSQSLGGQFGIYKYYLKSLSFIKFLYQTNNFFVFVLYFMINTACIPLYFIIYILKRLK